MWLFIDVAAFPLWPEAGCSPYPSLLKQLDFVPISSLLHSFLYLDNINIWLWRAYYWFVNYSVMLGLKALKTHTLYGVSFCILHLYVWELIWARIYKKMHKVLHFPFPSQWHQPLNSQHSFIILRWKCHCWSTPKTCSQASTSTVIHPILGTSVPHVFRTLLSCANLIDTAGNDLPSPPECGLVLSVLQTCRQEEHEPLKSVRWPSASQGTIWWLLPSQLGPCSSSWYKSCQAASTPGIFKHSHV